MIVSVISRKFLFSVTPRILRPIYSRRDLYPLYQCRLYSGKGSLEDVANVSFLDEPAKNVIPEVVHKLNSLGEPTLSSLGLCNYTPSGLVQYVMEFAHVHFNMPWWMAICTTCLTIRLCMLPVAVMMRRNQVNMSNNMPTSHLIDSQIQDAIERCDFDKIGELHKKKMEFMEMNGMGFKGLSPLFFNGFVFLSYYWGLRAMTQLPVESLKTGGILSFVDLTVPEPFYVLPLLASGTVLYVFETGAEGIKLDVLSKNVRNVFRGVVVCGFFFMTQFPSAITLYWFTSNIFSLVQSRLFLKKSVREFFNIPESVVHDKEFIEKLQNRQKEMFSMNKINALYKMAQEQEYQMKLAELKERQKKFDKSNIINYDETMIKSKSKSDSDSDKQSQQQQDKT